MGLDDDRAARGAGRRLDRHRVCVPAGCVPAGVGVLTTGTAELPVHLDPLPDVPAGTVAVGAETAARLGLDDVAEHLRCSE